MDLWSLHLKNSNRSLICAKNCPFWQRSSLYERPFYCNLGKLGPFRVDDGKILEIRVSKLRNSACPSLVVRAMGKKKHEDSSSSGSNDRSIPEGDGSKEDKPASNSNKSNDTTSHKSQNVISDWRLFRANLVAQGQIKTVNTDAPTEDKVSQHISKPLGAKWAHPISVPESGCVLVATEKLDGVRTFERTVILLLRSGTRNPREGPYGVIINRPIHKKIKHLKPLNLDLATTFGDCSLHFGGPLEASMFLLKTGENLKFPGFEEVLPGICYGSRNNLDEASRVVKKGVVRTQDFRFFIGYAGWQMDQLREEIESEYWYVAACSANLFFGLSENGSSEGLWEEILQLMGGHYSELSRKPKQDN